MGQAKHRGTYEQRAANPQGMVRTNRNSLGQFLRKREHFIHKSVDFTYNLEEKKWVPLPMYQNHEGSIRGVSYRRWDQLDPAAAEVVM